MYQPNHDHFNHRFLLDFCLTKTMWIFGVKTWNKIAFIAIIQN